jgi:hypothetical protein
MQIICLLQLALLANTLRHIVQEAGFDFFLIGNAIDAIGSKLFELPSSKCIAVVVFCLSKLELLLFGMLLISFQI